MQQILQYDFYAVCSSREFWSSVTEAYQVGIEGIGNLEGIKTR